MRRPASTPPDLRGYDHIRLLGSGGFSDVFLYEQQLPRRNVAVKVLLTEELTPATRAAFVAEANVMAQLSAHPYIVTIFHADVAADDRPYLVMEYCSGPSLAESYKRAPLPVADALRTAIRLSSAVATAHAAGILHRDIKPGNVLTNDFGWPALTDFGIASALEEEALPAATTTSGRFRGPEETGTGASIGLSVPWSPPEMFADDPQPDVRSDLFSLAATTWTILSGRTPFEVRGRGNGTLDLIGRIERGAITPMERGDVPASLTAVLRKGMASRREDRFSDAVAFARALQRVELELGYAPTPIEVPNVRVDEARGGETDGADATQVRSVATIQAQAPPPPPPAPPTAAAAVPAPSPAEEAATVLRADRVVHAQQAPPPSAFTVAVPVAAADPVHEATVLRPAVPAPPPGAPQAEAPPPPPAASRTRRILPWAIGAAAVLVAGAVTAGILLGGGAGPEPSPTADAGPTGAPVVVGTVPTPELAGPPAAEGSALSFAIRNPDPRDGDRFVWRTDPSPDPGYRPLDGDIVVLDDYVEGTTRCIEVFVLRDAKVSPVPLRACYPQ